MGQQSSATRAWAFGAIAVSAALTGCASGYSKSYQPAQGVTPEVITEQRAGSPAEPLVERLAPSAAPQELLAAYEKRGYVLIGSSAFNSDQRESKAGAIEQGRKVGADLVVILNPRPAGSTTSEVPVRDPASYRNSPVAAFGAYEVVNARENPTLRTTETQPATYVPVTVRRQDFVAGYFVKRR